MNSKSATCPKLDGKMLSKRQKRRARVKETEVIRREREKAEKELVKAKVFLRKLAASFSVGTPNGDSTWDFLSESDSESGPDFHPDCFINPPALGLTFIPAACPSFLLAFIGILVNSLPFGVSKKMGAGVV